MRAAPAKPKHAQMILAIRYLGALFSVKIFAATSPMAFAVATRTGVRIARWFSSGVLLLYHVERSGDVMKPPAQRRKQAK